jgi:peptide/nickel transport system substrate-binding protein
MTELYDGLVTKNYYDPKKPPALVPALAERWTISPDARTVTFFIRKGVRFHDGTRFDAYAALFNFRTRLDKDFKYYYPRGAAATARDLQEIESYRALDRWRFQIRLKRPFYPLLDVMSFPATTWMVSPGAIQKYGNEGIAQHPVGTGPFKFVEYSPGQFLRLERFDGYWRGPAAFKTLVFRPIVDPAARAAALQAGEVQVAEDISTEFAQAWRGRRDVRVAIASRPRMYSCFFNYTGDRPTKDRRFREALSLATDRGAMNVIVYDKLSNRARGFFAPGSPAFDVKRPLLAYNPTRATQLIRAGGWSGTKLTFSVSPPLGSPAVWDVLKQNFRAVGVDLTIKANEIVTWLGDFVRGMTPTSDLDGMCAAAGLDSFWGYAYYTSEAGLPENGGQNPGRYSNRGVEEIYARARQAKTDAEYVAAMKDADAAVTADYGMLFMLNDLNVEGVAAHVDWVPTKTQQHSFYSAKVYRR